MFSPTRAKANAALAALLALSVAGCANIPTGPAAQGGSPGSSNEAVNEAVGVQELRDELAELRDAVEVQRNELEKLQERQRQLYDDLDYRLRQTERGGAAGSGTAAPQRSGQIQQSYGQTQEQSGSQTPDETRTGESGSGQSAPSGQDSAARSGDEDIYEQQGIEQEGGVAGEPEGPAAGETPEQQQSAAIQQSPESGQQGSSSQQAVASADEQAAYDDAFDLLKQSRYNDAIIEFRSMISEFPNGALVDDAQYWIGEAYYVTRDFENAHDAFESVVNQYPDSQRVPEALLKLGYVQAELGRNSEARETLNRVISQYPGSRVAISAETRLSRLQ